MGVPRCPCLEMREAGQVAKAVRAHDAVIAGMVAIAETDGCPGVRGLRSALLARYGLGDKLQDIEDRHRGLTVLSCGHDIGGGITEYRMRLAPESRADLRDRTRPGVLVGGLDGGDMLGPETVRRLACDGALISAVLDSDGQLLRLGRTRRLFASAQVRGLWLRDRHCTFPRCTAPSTWCHAHHVRHGVDGGTSDLDNAALLCERHHTIVHRDRLTAAVTATGVMWNIVPGGYDRVLRGAAASDPPPRR